MQQNFASSCRRLDFIGKRFYIDWYCLIVCSKKNVGNKMSSSFLEGYAALKTIIIFLVKNSFRNAVFLIRWTLKEKKTWMRLIWIFICLDPRMDHAVLGKKSISTIPGVNDYLHGHGLSPPVSLLITLTLSLFFFYFPVSVSPSLSLSLFFSLPLPLSLSLALFFAERESQRATIEWERKEREQ